MLVICFSNNIVLRGRGFCTSSIAQITGNVPRLLADIVGFESHPKALAQWLSSLVRSNPRGSMCQLRGNKEFVRPISMSRDI